MHEAKVAVANAAPRLIGNIKNSDWYGTAEAAEVGMA